MKKVEAEHYHGSIDSLEPPPYYSMFLTFAPPSGKYAIPRCKCIGTKG